MGILDKKTRFIDLVVTQEGKRQMASGKLRAEFASLSDCYAFYDKSNKDDVSNRLYFEVMERPQNVIVLEKDDSGKINNFNNLSTPYTIVNNDVFSTSISGSLPITGSQFQSFFTDLESTILENFVNNYFLGNDNKNGSDDFEISKNEVTFTITNTQPFSNGAFNNKVNVNDAEPFFIDSKLSYYPTFDFLPPVNIDGSNYGVYTDIRSKSKETWDEIKNRLGSDIFKEELDSDSENEINLAGLMGNESRLLLDSNGLLPNAPALPKQSENIKFNKTSDKNNLIIQVYENSQGAQLTKLDIVDGGSFYDQSDPNKRYEKRVFYIGKIYFDDYNMPTFINLFTLVMD